jgi:hypothetical protein
MLKALCLSLNTVERCARAAEPQRVARAQYRATLADPAACPEMTSLAALLTPDPANEAGLRGWAGPREPPSIQLLRPRPGPRH